MERVEAVGCCHGESFWKLDEILTGIIEGEEQVGSRTQGCIPYGFDDNCYCWY